MSQSQGTAMGLRAWSMLKRAGWLDSGVQSLVDDGPLEKYSFLDPSLSFAPFRPFPFVI
jgi:hypothetical protein